MKPTLVPGLDHTLRFVVPASKTVPALYPESAEFRAMPAVFATGFLVGLIEWVALLVVLPHLDEGEQTLGTRIDVTHEAATPAGLIVTARARLVRVDGRRLVFEVEADDGIDTIARGTHERAVIVRARFDARLEEKATRAPRA